MRPRWKLDYLRSCWASLPLWLRMRCAWQVWAGQIAPTPPPVRFAFVAAMFSFIFLIPMPLEPLAMPAALGGGTACALISNKLRKPKCTKLKSSP